MHTESENTHDWWQVARSKQFKTKIGWAKNCDVPGNAINWQVATNAATQP